MEGISLLKERRSIRKYKSKQIKDEELSKVLDAALWAPSAKNSQETVMVVVQDKKTIEELSLLNGSVMGSNSDPFYGAPTVIVVLSKKAANADFDGSLVMSYLMLAATEIGLGSCWINRAREVFEMDEGKAILKRWGLEGEWVGIGNCILGYSDEEGSKKERKRDRIIFVK